MSNDKLLKILCCPECKGSLIKKEETLFCQTDSSEYKIRDGIPVFHADSEGSWDIDISNKKWHEFYKNFDWLGGKKHYNASNMPSIEKFLKPLSKGDYFLEIGGGASYLSFALTRMGIEVVIVDFDIDILRIAKKYFEENGCSGLFVCANIQKLPFCNDVFDISAGIGVIEHTDNIALIVRELYRVTKDSGYTFQTIPYFSFNTLCNNSIRFGTYTPIKLINRIISFVHIDILKGKYMRYGYEQSYSPKFVDKLFKVSGFQKVDLGFYDYNQTILGKRKYLGWFFYYLIRFKFFRIMPFADILYIKANKT